MTPAPFSEPAKFPRDAAKRLRKLAEEVEAPYAFCETLRLADDFDRYADEAEAASGKGKSPRQPAPPPG